MEANNKHIICNQIDIFLYALSNLFNFLFFCYSCLETIYWHLIEKRFCYDENIALYEEPYEKSEKNNNMFDNMAFYDSVAVIAGRAVVTIDPLPEKTKQQPPIVQQPTKKLRWWEDEENNVEIKKSAPSITEVKSEASISSDEGIEIKHRNSLSADEKPEKEEELEKLEVKRDQRSPSVNKLSRAQTLAVIDDGKRGLRLKERRMSRSQTFNFNTGAELPLVRQLSMPKFYLDTPDINQTEATIVKPPSSALSPVQPGISQFNFDLRSVVQMEKEKEKGDVRVSVPVHGEPERSSRLAQIREKLNPLKIRRQHSMTNVPNSSVHM